MDFGSLRILEGQFGLFNQIYARFGGRTLLFLVQMYEGDHHMYALQIVHGCTRDHTDVRYFLEYPLNNTWTYDTTFGQLCK